MMAEGVSLTVVKVIDLPSDPQYFDFDLTGVGLPADLDVDTDPGSADLPSQQTISLSSAKRGENTATASPVTGWSLTGITCNDPTNDSSVSLATRTVTL